MSRPLLRYPLDQDKVVRVYSHARLQKCIRAKGVLYDEID